MTICQLLKYGITELKQAGSSSPVLDAEVLLGMSLCRYQRELKQIVDKTCLYIHPEKKITNNQETRYKKMIRRRVKGEPVAYILGFKEFYGLKFLGNRNVLIPRPETELIIDEIKKVTSNMRQEIRKNVFIDVGTGSGCIPIVLANKMHNLLGINYYGVDNSKQALIMAKKNARLHGVEKKIKFIKSDLLEYFLHNTLSFMHNTNLIITANLPYLSEKIYQENYQNLKFEPRDALVAGTDGLKYYRELIRQIMILLRQRDPRFREDDRSEGKMTVPGIVIFLEINPEQKKSMTRLIKRNFPGAKIEFKKDLSRRVRLVKIEI